MAARKPLVLIDGLVTELPAEDGVSGEVLPNIAPAPGVEDLQQGSLSIDSDRVGILLRIGDLVYRFSPDGLGSYIGKLDFSVARNSHWIGVML